MEEGGSSVALQMTVEHIAMTQDKVGVLKEGTGEIISSSWNVKVINVPVKALAHLRSLDSEIIYLHETRLKKFSHLILIREGILFEHRSRREIPYW